MSRSDVQPGLPQLGDEAMARALRDSDDRLRSVINSASMVLWALDARGTFTFSDGGALRLLGLRPGEVVGRSVFDVYGSVPQIVEDNRRALAGEEFTTVRQVGDSTFEARYSVQRNRDGEVTGVIGVAVDVTDRLRIEREREHSLSLLRATLEATVDGIVVLDTQGRIVSFNRRFAELWRLPAELVESRDAERVLARMREQLREPRELLAAASPPPGSSDAQSPDVLELADGRTLERNLQPQRLGDAVVGHVWSFRDITQHRQAEAMLLQRAAQAARFQEALMELAKSRSDELEAALERIVQVDAHTLDVQRVSVWLFDADGSELVCATLHTRDGAEAAGVSSLRADLLPDYFAALHQHRVIAAHDAVADPATHEFAESYLIPLGITSMLDVPIWRDGSMVGVVCHEHVGRRRSWSVEEQDFAASIADMVSLALEAAERRRTEAALRASEASYRAIFELSNDAICVHDLETGEILDVNRAACTMHGYTAAEMRERGIGVLCSGAAPYTAEVVRQHFRRAAQGEPQRVEWQARHRSGRLFWQEIDLQRVAINGEDRLLSTARDITARKEAEQVLRRSHEELERLVGERTRDLAQTNRVLQAQIAERERAEGELRQKSSELEAVFHALPDLYFRLDSAGRFLDYKAGQSAGLYMPADVLGKRLQDVLPAEMARAVGEGVREVGGAGGLVCVEYALSLADGEHQYEARLVPFGDGQIITIVRDITEQKATQRALERSEEHFRRITENSSDVASILDGRGVSVYHSPSIERVLGYRPEEILGSSAFARIHPDDHERCRAVLGEMFRTPGTTHTVEFRYLHKDGSWRTLEVFGRTLLPDSAAEGVIINARDVTERKAAEEALRRAIAEAERANRAKSEFLSRMSHELRTPMNSILGFAQLLARKPLAADELRAVDHILKGGRHLLNLINEVLDIARIEADRQPLSLEPVRADTAVEEALNLIRPLAVQRGCRIEERHDLPEILVRADRQRLTQVLLNLLSNAVKYNRKGGSAWIVWELPAAEAGPRLRIGVRDAGPGIAHEKLDRIFEPFERLGAEGSGEEGTGLGLALARRLVEAMGGTLTAESTPGEGSTFWVELKVESSPLERLAHRDWRASAASAQGSLPTATILYIEDNLANLTLVETILDFEPDIKLVPALQGQLGHELACEHRPDLILLDLHLPDIPGTEVLRRLQNDPRTREIPVIMISADAMHDSVERLLQSGASAYLTKPLDVDQFLETLRRFLDRGSGR